MRCSSVGCLALSLLAPCAVSWAGSGLGGASLTLAEVAQIELPVFLTHAPGDAARLFVIGQAGQIWIIKDGTVLDRPFLDISEKVQTAGTSQGLLGLAFHPEYEMNGFFYLTYTRLPDGASVVARLRATADPDIADPESEQFVLTVPQQAPTHNVGWLGFGPNDAYLYIGSGDGGGPLDPGDDAQNIDSLLGKILRIDVDGDDFPEDPQRNYAIPPDNPFVGQAGADEIWAYGLRQPWRCSFDRETGDLYIADVGQSSWEELNFQPGTSAGGENYGWDCLEGTQCTGEPTCECGDPTLVHPIHVYPNPGVGRSVIAGYTYRGCAIPDLLGDFLFADHCSSRIWRLEHDGGRIIELEEISNELDPGGNQLHKPASFGEDLYGEIYFCARTSGKVFKIIADGDVGPDCNRNGASDACDIADGTSMDTNGNGVPDECEVIGDLNGDGTVGTADLLILLANWGPCADCNDCPADIDGSCTVGLADLLLLLANWG